MYKHTNRAVRKIVHALTLEGQETKINATDRVLAYLLLLATLIIATIFAPAALYDEMYKRYTKRKQKKRT